MTEHTLVESAWDAPASGVVTCPGAQSQEGEDDCYKPAGTSGLPGLWSLYLEGNLGICEAWGCSWAVCSLPPPLLMDLMCGCSVPMGRVAGLRVAGPGWYTRFPGLGPSPQFRLDEEQMCASTPGPPALLLPSSTVLCAQGTDSFQMGWPLS